MSDENAPTNEQPEVPATASTPDTTPTEALQLADQQPVATEAAPAPTAAAAAPRTNHTRTILEVVGGVVAAGLIVTAGAVGFVVGHATSGPDDFRLERAAQQWNGGPDAGGPFGDGQGRGQGHGQAEGQRDGQGMGPGMGQGFGQRGEDPDGDNWTGQNRGQRDGQGMGPGMGQGFGQRGEDPDGDNWTGQNRGPGMGQGYGPQGGGDANGLQDGTGPMMAPTPSTTG